VAFSPDGKQLGSASGYRGKGEVKIWDASTWNKNKTSTLSLSGASNQRVQVGKKAVDGLAATGNEDMPGVAFRHFPSPKPEQALIR
jgi:hypothetical protein